VRVRQCVTQKGVRLIGPNSPGILTPGEAKAGIIPGAIAQPGSIGVVSRSGTLTYEVLFALQKAGNGISTCVGIGGDPIIGSSFIAILELFEADPHTERVVLIGEIGGTEEERAADYISHDFSKPVIGLVAGLTAPTDKRMGHAGAIIESGSGLAKDKIAALESAGVRVALQPEDVPNLMNAI
jgi:succinyl-CoA synthetase alpha subunit